MATSPAVTTQHAAAGAPNILVDEELWFGSNNSDAAEAAAASSMAATAGRVVGAKPFPAAAQRLAQLALHEGTKLGAFVEVLEQDPALSAKLLRMVNSAGFGLRQRCATVQHAVTLVGSKQLYNIATTAAVIDMFDAESSHAVQVLEHSAVVAAFCRYLGVHLSLPAEELFTAGMLHDLGKLMLLEAQSSVYGALIEQCNGEANALHSLERQRQGFDHGVLAAHVLKAWNIPDPIPKMVAWHHEPARAYASSSAHAALVQTLRLADTLDHALARGLPADAIEALAHQDAANYLDISEAQLGAMLQEFTALRNRTLAHARGESDENTTHDRPNREVGKASPQAAPNVPRQFRCACCASPSYGATCAACKGYVCPEHPLNDAGWCPLCVAEYRIYAAAHRHTKTLRQLAAAALVTSATTTLLGANHTLIDGWARGIAAGVLLSTFAVAALWLIQRTRRRSSFICSRPDRSQSTAKAR